MLVLVEKEYGVGRGGWAWPLRATAQGHRTRDQKWQTVRLGFEADASVPVASRRGLGTDPREQWSGRIAARPRGGCGRREGPRKRHGESQGEPMANRGTGHHVSAEFSLITTETKQFAEVVSAGCPAFVCFDLSARGMWARHVYQGFSRCGRLAAGAAVSSVIAINKTTCDCDYEDPRVIHVIDNARKGRLPPGRGSGQRQFV